jgi:hypothetical protein
MFEVHRTGRVGNPHKSAQECLCQTRTIGFEIQFNGGIKSADIINKQLIRLCVSGNIMGKDRFSISLNETLKLSIIYEPLVSYQRDNKLKGY